MFPIPLYLIILILPYFQFHHPSLSVPRNSIKKIGQSLRSPYAHKPLGQKDIPPIDLRMFPDVGSSFTTFPA